MMDKFMKKYYIDNYNSEQLEQIKKLDKLLTETHSDIFDKRKKNIFANKKEKKKLQIEEIEEIFNKIEDMYFLTSFLTKEKIIELIIKCNGDEDKIQEEIEKIL